MPTYSKVVTYLLLLMPAAALGQESLRDPCIDPPMRIDRINDTEAERRIACFDITTTPNQTPGLVGELDDTFDDVYAYVSERLRSAGPSRIQLRFSAADRGNCPARGRAFGSMVEIMAGPDWSREQILGIVAHEIAHVLHWSGSDLPRPNDGQMEQGIASWGAGRYWAAMLGADTLADVVRGYLDSGSYVALDRSDELARASMPSLESQTTPVACVSARDILYTQWAAFVDFLIARDGRERFAALLRTGGSDSANGLDYESIYERSLGELEAEWHASLRANR